MSNMDPASASTEHHKCVGCDVWQQTIYEFESWLCLGCLQDADALDEPPHSQGTLQ